MGFGTGKQRMEKKPHQAVLAALSRLPPSTAAIYQNEGVGRAIKDSGLAREPGISPNFGILITPMKTLKLLWKSLLRN